jgi:predicted phosphohydrolase
LKITLVTILLIIGLIAGAVIIAAAISQITQKPEQLPPVDEPIINETKPPIVCGNGTKLVNNTCVPIPKPTPAPQPQPTPQPQPEPPRVTKTINWVGDVHGSAGEQVFNRIKVSPFDLTVVLGDLWYGNWEKFQQTYGTLGNKVACVLGNHEYDSSEVERLSLAYCENDWILGENEEYNGVMIIGVNANEGLTAQLNKIKANFNNATFMKGTHTVILATHQPCFNTEGSKHGVEQPAFCKAFDAAVPNGIHEYYLAGHEHLMMKGQDGDKKFFISGAGGRTHYDCGKLDSIHTWCDDSHYGFLQMKIEPDGDITTKFIDYNGVEVK